MVISITLILDKEGKDKEGKDKPSLSQLPVPRLSVCADAQKVDRAKLAQTEFSIIEFDPETFRILLDYLHTGSCPLTCSTIPGLICAAEHYDLPELLQACFHHAKQFLRIDVVSIWIRVPSRTRKETISGVLYAVFSGELLLEVHIGF